MARTRTTLTVDPVKPAEKPVWTESLADSLNRRFQRKIFVLPGEAEQVINAHIGSYVSRVRSEPEDDTKLAMRMKYLGSRCHPLVDAVHVAFSQHRPLILSPDAIWLVIAQGFSHHTSENAESLRARLVRHEGSRELEVEALELTVAGFETVIADISSLIREQIDPVLHETLVCDFSTTSPATRMASARVLMDTFASYFTYSIVSICGIPKITIEGTLRDWQRIRARIEVLATYELEWWVSRLRPILDEFILAAKGSPTQSFWQAIYKPKQAYGDHVATGWITDLFPYLGDAPGRRRNTCLDHERQDWALTVENGLDTRERFYGPPVGYGAGLKTFPSGLSSSRIKVSLEGQPTLELDLVAGFLAVTQDPSDMAVAPLVGWCVAEPPPGKPGKVL